MKSVFASRFPGVYPSRPGRFGPASMEAIIRPFVAVTSLPKPRQPQAPEQENPTSFLRWGQPSEFTGDDDFRDTATAFPGFTTEDDKPPERKRLVYSELGRSFTDVRIENPDDPTQYAIVRMCNGFAVTTPDGGVRRNRILCRSGLCQ